MVDAKELNILNDAVSKEGLKLAKTTTISASGAAKVTFYGEESESQKEFNYLASYEPALNDIVLMLPIADTYIIIGSINSFATTPNNYVTSSDLSTAISNFVTVNQLNNALSSYATTSSLANYAAATHKHSEIYSTEQSLSNNVVYYREGQSNFTFRPSSTGTQNLGNSSYKWTALYATNGTIQTSDLRTKRSVKRLSEKYEKFFRLLNPISYRFKGEKVTHTGLGAQHVEEAIKASGLRQDEFYGLVKDEIKDTDGNVIDYDYGLNYAEFIALNTHMIQKLMSRVEQLENEVNILKGGKSCQ